MQICHNLRRGGAERLVLQLSHAYENHGHKIFVVTLEDKNEYMELSRNIPIQPLSNRGLGKWPFCVPRFAWRLRNVIKIFKPDIIECHLPTAALVTAFGKCNTPSILVVHDSVSKGIWRYIECLSARLIGGHIIAVSESVRSDVEEKLFLRNVYTVTNGIDLELFPFRENRVRSNRPVVGVLGTICRKKRPDVALAAFTRLKRNFPNATLKFIGDGPMKDEIISMVHRYDLANNVFFTGQVSNVSKALQGVNVLWQLSEHEGFPLSVAEAMSSGIPVVGFDVSGICNAITDSVTGYLVPKGDINSVAERTSFIIQTKGILKNFSICARRYAENNLQLEQMINGHLSILHRVSKMNP